MQFKLNDCVEWTSQAGGSSKHKRGTVVAIVPAGKLPREVFDGKIDAGTCSARNHESYVVHVGFKWYWPHASKLSIDGSKRLEEGAPDADRIIRHLADFCESVRGVSFDSLKPDDGYDGATEDQTLADTIRAYLKKVDGGK